MALIDASKLPKDKDLATKLIESETQSELDRRDRGLLGKLFGNKESAPFYISGVVLFLLIIFLIAFCFIGQETVALSKKDVLILILPIVTSIIGFFFGSKDKK